MFCSPYTLGAVLLALAIGSFFGGVLIPPTIHRVLKKELLLQLVPSTNQPPNMFREFLDDGATAEDLANPMLRTYYMFNITNPEEVRQGSKPILEEVGPFRYYVRNRRLEVSFSYEGTVRWHPFSSIVPLPPQPGDPPPYARITTINLAIMGAVMSMEATLGPGVRLGATLRALRGLLDLDPDAAGFMVTKPATDLLWGYEDITLKRLRAISPVPVPSRVSIEIAPRTEQEALCFRGVSEKLTGATNPRRMSDMMIWNDMSDLDALWGLDPVEGGPRVPVKGSDGFGFGFSILPMVDRSPLAPNDTSAACSDAPDVTLWVGDSFRSMALRCGQASSVKGVPTLRYFPGAETWGYNPVLDQRSLGLWNLTTPYGRGVLSKATDCGIMNTTTNDSAVHRGALAGALASGRTGAAAGALEGGLIEGLSDLDSDARALLSDMASHIAAAARDAALARPLGMAIEVSVPHIYLSPPHFCYPPVSDPTTLPEAPGPAPDPYIDPPGLLTPQALRDGVVGLRECATEADALQSATIFEIEPYSGLPLSATVRIQLSSTLTDRYPAIDGLLPRAIVPIMHVEVTKQADDGQAAAFRDGVLMALRLADLLAKWLPVTGGILLALGIACAALCPTEDDLEDAAEDAAAAAAAGGAGKGPRSSLLGRAGSHTYGGGGQGMRPWGARPEGPAGDLEEGFLQGEPAGPDGNGTRNQDGGGSNFGGLYRPLSRGNVGLEVDVGGEEEARQHQESLDATSAWLGSIPFPNEFHTPSELRSPDMASPGSGFAWEGGSRGPSVNGAAVLGAALAAGTAEGIPLVTGPLTEAELRVLQKTPLPAAQLQPAPRDGDDDSPPPDQTGASGAAAAAAAAGGNARPEDSTPWRWATARPQSPGPPPCALPGAGPVEKPHPRIMSPNQPRFYLPEGTMAAPDTASRPRSSPRSPLDPTRAASQQSPLSSGDYQHSCGMSGSGGEGESEEQRGRPKALYRSPSGILKKNTADKLPRGKSPSKIRWGEDEVEEYEPD